MLNLFWGRTKEMTWFFGVPPRTTIMITTLLLIHGRKNSYKKEKCHEIIFIGSPKQYHNYISLYGLLLRIDFVHVIEWEDGESKKIVFSVVQNDDTRDHLFFVYPYTSTVWNGMIWMMYATTPDWQDTLTSLLNGRLASLNYVHVQHLLACYYLLYKVIVWWRRAYFR